MVKKINFGSFGWVLVIILSLIPVLIWVEMLPFHNRVNDFPTVIVSIGQIAGLVGMMMFAHSLILSSRFRIFQRLFLNLTQVYSAHRLIGKIAMYLLTLHLVTLVLGYSLHSWELGLRLLIPGMYSWPATFGGISFWSLILLLTFTIFIKLPYEKWKWTHKFLGVSFVFGILHLIGARSDTHFNYLLRGYMLSYSGLALLIYIYWTLLGRFIVIKTYYRIKEIKNINQQVIEIDLLPLDRKLNFTAGQYVFVRFLSHDYSHEVHPFSISSAPNQEDIELTIKALGDFTSKIKSISNDVLVELEGPYGNFSNAYYQGHDQVWIAGGIGITPFLSMVRNLDSNLSNTIDLYYSVVNSTEAVYQEELKSVESQIGNFHLHVHDTSQSGFLTGDQIILNTPNYLQRDFFLCGPLVMVKNIKKQLISKGVPPAQIHSEEFNFSF